MKPTVTKHTIDELIVRWIKVKEKMPQTNSNEDPLYDGKFMLLLSGVESLEDNSYEAWSKDVEIRRASEFQELYFHPDQTLPNLVRLLVMTIYFGLINEYVGNEDKDAGPVDDNILMYGILATSSIHALLDILNDFKSAYLLKILDSKTGSNPSSNASLNEFIRELLTLMNTFPDAIKEMIKPDATQITAFVLNTLGTSKEYTDHAIKYSLRSTKGKQQSVAAKIKNKPNRQTKDHVVSLYEQKSWPSTRAASIGLVKEARQYGSSVGFHFTDDYAAQKRIYDWLLKSVNR